MTKIFLWILTDRRERERIFEKVWIVINTWKTYDFKKLFERFSIDRKIDSIDRKLHSFDPAAIEHQLNQADSNQNFNHNFDQSSNKFDQSKIKFDQSSNDQASIEPGRFKPNFNRNFDRLRNRFDWSKIWKKQIFEKQNNFMQKLHKT